MARQHRVVFLNPRTCGIYKGGTTRFKREAKTGRWTEEVDNELLDHVDTYIAGGKPRGMASVPLRRVLDKRVLVPTYYDTRLDTPIKSLLRRQNVKGITIGELIDSNVITVRGGHGSPGNDQRTGHIPYIKVSDIRGLRVNINPTNLVSEEVARRLWRGQTSGLKTWDLMTPNRASSNIGEFAILLPGEEQIVVTKEVFVFRHGGEDMYDPFYLLWALSLKPVREQWRRIALMQTNREDCGGRYREIIIPKPRSRKWALNASKAFCNYFTTMAEAKKKFSAAVTDDAFEYVANVAAQSVQGFAPEGRGSPDGEDGSGLLGEG